MQRTVGSHRNDSVPPLWQPTLHVISIAHSRPIKDERNAKKCRDVRRCYLEHELGNLSCAVTDIIRRRNVARLAAACGERGTMFREGSSSDSDAAIFARRALAARCTKSPHTSVFPIGMGYEHVQGPQRACSWRQRRQEVCC